MTTSTILAEMEWNPQIIIAIVFLVFSGLKWLMDKSKNKESENDSDLEDIYEQYREQIQKRQTTVITPKPVDTRITVQQRPKASTPPPLPAEAQTPKAALGDYIQATRKTSKPQLTKAEQAALAAIQANQGKKGRKKRSGGQLRYSKLLASRSKARDAIVLSEILGPPKALR